MNQTGVRSTRLASSGADEQRGSSRGKRIRATSANRSPYTPPHGGRRRASRPAGPLAPRSRTAREPRAGTTARPGDARERRYRDLALGRRATASSSGTTGWTRSAIPSSGRGCAPRSRTRSSPVSGSSSPFGSRPRPPGRYRPRVRSGRGAPLLVRVDRRRRVEVEVDVAPRIAAVASPSSSTAAPDPATEAALAAQEEPVVERTGARPSRTSSPGAAPAPDWSRRVLDAHAEGWAAVGPARPAGTLERRRAAGSPPGAGWPEPRLDAPAAAAVARSPARARRARRAFPPDGRATGSSRAARSSGFRRDPVVDRPEHARADGQRDDGRDAR